MMRPEREEHPQQTGGRKASCSFVGRTVVVRSKFALFSQNREHLKAAGQENSQNAGLKRYTPGAEFKLISTIDYRSSGRWIAVVEGAYRERLPLQRTGTQTEESVVPSLSAEDISIMQMKRILTVKHPKASILSGSTCWKHGQRVDTIQQDLRQWATARETLCRAW
jgi:hypothetical protein